ncbi:MAG: thioredoxin-dependent thiol peroxidase [Spirochaetales bacterium]|jgi:thioredoxin-dependent peroxiredoxin|nr:thioredoxin-dependent thiol peroxidase [Spirochaetales bacterium]
MLKENSMAPDFELPNENGELVKLSSFRGQKVVVYFYPKDDTPGCTKEACSFRDAKPIFDDLNAVVIGISRDGGTSHQGFIAKHGLNFTLLSDEDHKVMEEYGAWGEKMLYGKVSIGVIRSTFIIDEEGKILKTYYKVNTAIHGQAVSNYLRGLKA